MIKGETVSEMEKRFTEIIHPLKSLGKTFANEEIVKRFMKAMIPPYTSKIDAIEEGRDFHKLTLDILVSKLMKKEMELKKDEEDVPKGKAIALRANSVPNDTSEEELDSDEDIAMLSRKFKSFLKKKKQEGKFVKKKPLSKGETSKNDEIICYRCKKPGHMKWDCPLRRTPKEKKTSKRAYGAWTDEDESDDEASDVEEVANLCFMAIDDGTQDEVISPPSLTYTFEELQEAFDELLDNFKIIRAKNVSLKKSMSKLTSENDQMKHDLNALHDELNLYKTENDSVKNENIALTIELRDTKQSMRSKLDDTPKENELLKNENANLKKKCDDLNASLAKFVNGRERLDAILGSQRASYRKEGLGFVPYTKRQDASKSSFIKASTSSTPFVTCYYCGRKGHISQSCWYKRNEHKIKTMWVPRNHSKIMTNKEGPKRIWVPIQKS
jgi:cell division protein FtsB